MNGLEDIKFMKNSSSWPRWPLLPIKRRGNPSPECALLLADEGPVIHKVDLYTVTEESIKTAPVERFDSFEAIVSAGWRVD